MPVCVGVTVPPEADTMPGKDAKTIYLWTDSCAGAAEQPVRGIVVTVREKWRIEAAE